MKSYVVVKCFYGDFDVPKYEIVGVAMLESIAKLEVEKLNAKRSKSEIKEETEYDFIPTTVIGLSQGDMMGFNG
jgi:hypothetical protein